MSHSVSSIASVGWISSLALHAAAVACLLQTSPRERVRLPPATVTMSVVAPPRVTPPPPAANDRVKPPVATKTLAPISTPKITKVTPKVTPVANAPADLTGVTLTGNDGAGWASMTGNGQAMDTPIRPTVAAPAVTAASDATRVSRPSPPPIAIVPAKELGTKPTPPALNASLLANYPPLAKRQGLPGRAKLLVRIDSDGVVRQCTVRSESSADFGTACQKTLLGSRWSPPRDHLGKAVVTQVYYTCDFRVNGS